LPGLPLDYTDYAEWVRSRSTDNVHHDYWAGKLAGELRRLNLPTLEAEDAFGAVAAYASVHFGVTGERAAGVKAFTRAGGVSDYMFFLSVFFLMLNKVTGDEDLVVGTDGQGRDLVELEEIVGTFVNVLPLRMSVADDDTYSGLLAALKQCVLEAFEHQAYPFEQMVALTRDRTGSLVDVHFAFSNAVDSRQELAELKFNPVRLNEKQTAEYPFQVEVYEHDGGFELLFIYDTARFDESIIRVFADGYTHILHAVLADPHAKIGRIGLGASVAAADFAAGDCRY